jgi:predicted ATPase
VAERAGTNPQEVRGRIIEEIAEWLNQLALHRPILLLVDDLQWCDESSLLVFRTLASQIGQSRLLLIGAFRSEEVSDGSDLGSWRYEEGTSSLELSQLTEGQLADFLERLLGENSLGREFVTDTLHLTEGNPFL